MDHASEGGWICSYLGHLDRASFESLKGVGAMNPGPHQKMIQGSSARLRGCV